MAPDRWEGYVPFGMPSEPLRDGSDAQAPARRVPAAALRQDATQGRSVGQSAPSQAQRAAYGRPPLGRDGLDDDATRARPPSRAPEVLVGPRQDEVLVQHGAASRYAFLCSARHIELYYGAGRHRYSTTRHSQIPK